MKWLRKKLIKWLGLPTVEPAPPEPEGLNISPATLHQMLVKTGERFIVERKVRPPVLHPAVRGNFQYDAKDDPGRLGPPVAFDDVGSAPLWQYMNQANCGLGFAGFPYLAELSQRSEYRAPVETLATEATREWFEIVVRGKGKKKDATAVGSGEDADGDGDIDGGLEDKIEQLEKAIEEFKLRDIFRQLSEDDGFFGCAHLYIDIDPGSEDRDEVNQLPLVASPETIKKGSLRAFRRVEAMWASPYTYNSSDPTRPDYYKPRAWYVVGKRIHASRFLTFIARPVPDMLKPAYNFGGISMSQLMEPYVFQWLRTRNAVSDLVHNFSVMCLKTDMSAVLQGDAEAGSGLLARAKLFVQTRDNNGLTVLDMKKEDLAAVNVPLSTLDKLQAQAQEHMAAPSHVPLVKLTGITPAGLNANSDGEIQVWYDFTGAYQESFFGQHTKRILDILQCHLFGEIDNTLTIQWKPLSSPTVKELSEIRKADAETDAIYIDKGVISPEESRERVAADPNSGFDNLTGPAPLPPMQMDAEHGLGLEKDKAEHQAGLSEEAAQAAHERQLEAEAAKKAA